jgi:sec-independent protein translocase protein TatB
MGWAEITVIGIVGILVFGPDKLPEFARQAGRFVRTVRRMAQDAKDDLGRELGHDLSGLDVKDLDPRQVVRRAILDDMPKPAAPPRQAAPPPTFTPGDRPPVDPEAT